MGNKDLDISTMASWVIHLVRKELRNDVMQVLVDHL